MGNFVVFLFGVYALYHFVLAFVLSVAFQTNTWPRVQEWYKRRLTWLLKGYRPIGVVVFMIVLFFRIDSIFYFARSKSWVSSRLAILTLSSLTSACRLVPINA
jgi:hypothetical protein